MPVSRRSSKLVRINCCDDVENCAFTRLRLPFLSLVLISCELIIIIVVGENKHYWYSKNKLRIIAHKTLTSLNNYEAMIKRRRNKKQKILNGDCKRKCGGAHAWLAHDASLTHTWIQNIFGMNEWIWAGDNASEVNIEQIAYI